jgi:hypothetical protein
MLHLEDFVYCSSLYMGDNYLLWQVSGQASYVIFTFLSMYFFPEQVCYIDETHVSWNVQTCSWSSRCQLSIVISTHTFPSSCCRTWHSDAQSPLPLLNVSYLYILYLHFLKSRYLHVVIAWGILYCWSIAILLAFCRSRDSSQRTSFPTACKEFVSLTCCQS